MDWELGSETVEALESELSVDAVLMATVDELEESLDCDDSLR